MISPSKLEALAACRVHRDYYRNRVAIESAKGEHGRAVSAIAAAAVVERLMDTFQGKQPPLGVKS